MQTVSAHLIFYKIGMKTTITITLELSNDDYALVSNIENLNDLIKRAAQRKLYALILEAL